MAAGDYITSTDLGQLSCMPAAMLAGIDGATVAANISAASRFVDSYCAARFPGLPFTAWDLDVKVATANVCGYWLAARFGYDTDGNGDSDFRRRYDDAVRWLAGVRDGSVHPSVGVSVPSADTLSYVVSDDPRGW